MTAPLPVTIEENQLVIAKDLSAVTLDQIKPVLEKYKQINADMVFDVRSPEGNKAARSHVFKLRKIKKPIEDRAEALNAGFKTAIAEAKKGMEGTVELKKALISTVDEMISVHTKSLDAVEAEEAEALRLKNLAIEIEQAHHVANEMNAMIDQQRELERQAAEQARVAKELADKQAELERIERERKVAEEAAESARLQERAKAEAERLAAEDRARREKEASERAAREAQDRERKAAEQAAQALRDQEAKAKRERQEAEARHQRELEAERQRIKAEEDRKAQEEAERVAEASKAAADLENIKRVNNAILSYMVALGIETEKAKDFILAAKAGEVPAMSIDYQWQPA